MSRQKRINLPGWVYHVICRSSGIDFDAEMKRIQQIVKRILAERAESQAELKKTF